MITAHPRRTCACAEPRRYAAAVVERKDVASWLEGPRPRGGAQDDAGYAGQRLGLPADGPGSVAGFGRRLAAVTIDWLACVILAQPFSNAPWAPLAVFAGMSLLLLSTLSATFGMRLLGLGVARLGVRGLVSPLRVTVRTVLLCLVIPAVIWDRDGRGLHDKAVGTVVIRTR
jgi:hypothetical protein